MKALRGLWPYLAPYRKWLVLAPLTMCLEVALDLAQPRLVQRIVDVGIAQNNMQVVWISGLWMLCLACVGILAGALCGAFATIAAQSFAADLRAGLFAKIQTLSFANLDELDTGSLITRLTNDVNQLQEVVGMLLRVMVRVPLMLVGSLILAIMTSPKLALLFIPLFPFVLGVISWVITRSYPLFGEVQQRLDKLNTVLQENLSGVRVVKAFARTNSQIERFKTTNDDLLGKNVEVAKLGVVTMPLMMLAVNCGVVAAVWWGGLQVRSGDLTSGQIIAFVNYLGQTLMSLMMVSMLVVRLARAEASGQRVNEVFRTPAAMDSESGRSPMPIGGAIQFKDVSFQYSGASEPVLCGVSFTVEPGETVAILGATGSGKSTLIQLLARFYDVTRGQITIGGTNIQEINREDLRSSISVALQEAVLFSGTIGDNIRYGRPHATESEVRAAAEDAQAAEFIERLPDGYETTVGQRGVNLSGGQKQRVAIARALLSQPEILILDDSTSAVDVRTEAKIQTALARSRGEQTRFIVAQRISAAQGADRILVLENGRICGNGRHEDLLVTCPVYREIYESQIESGVMAHV